MSHERKRLELGHRCVNECIFAHLYIVRLREKEYLSVNSTRDLQRHGNHPSEVLSPASLYSVNNVQLFYPAP